MTYIKNTTTTSKKVSFVYLEHSRPKWSKFWKCQITPPNKKTVTITFGKCGTIGRKIDKIFKTEEDAKKYFQKQVNFKRKLEFKDAKEKNITLMTNERNKHKTSSVSLPPSIQKGFGGHTAANLTNPEYTVDGMISVDSGLAKLDSALASRANVHDTLHARLTLIDESKNSDKYYILQVIIDGSMKKQNPEKVGAVAGGSTAQYYLLSRWGRTGTGGVAKLDGPMQDKDEAKIAFCKAFESKVGTAWSKATPGMKTMDAKYEYLNTFQHNKLKSASWFYYLHNDPLGKPNNWYAYDGDNNEEVELLYVEFMSSKQAKRFSIRFVHSESSGFTYRIDLSKMNQVNTQTGKVRPIRRMLGL